MLTQRDLAKIFAGEGMNIASAIRRVRTRLFLLWMVGVAPSAPAHEKEVRAFRTHHQPTIDSVLDDADWKRATPAALAPDGGGLSHRRLEQALLSYRSDGEDESCVELSVI